jgi:hypothetical protein
MKEKKKQKMEIDAPKYPLSFQIVKWYAYIFAAFYLLYGGVKIVLGVLDRNYQDFAQPFIFLLFGIVLVSLAVAFADNRRWGWYGLVAMNVLVVLGSLFSLSHPESWALIILALGALVALLSPKTKQQFF